LSWKSLVRVSMMRRVMRVRWMCRRILVVLFAFEI
jgi:hypothetical protein